MRVKAATKRLPAPKVDRKFLEEMVASVASESAKKSVLVIPPKLRKDKMPSTRIDRPKLPSRKKLTLAQHWKAHLWMINTAQAHGIEALRGLTIALARMVQADAFDVLFFDARERIGTRGKILDLLWDPDLPITKDGQTLYQLLSPCRRSRKFNLGSAALITSVWEPWRLMRALQCLGPECEWGGWRQDSNHHAIAWYPWPLVWVDNGNHSATAAALKGGGQLECEAAFDATPLLMHVTTDGRRWFGQDGRVLGRVHSMPMAGIIEIGRRLTELKHVNAASIRT